MTEYEWSVMICKVDGLALKKWLEKHAATTGANAKQIAKLVGQTGPQRGPVANAVEKIMRKV